MSDLVIETHSLHKQYGHTHAVDGLEMHVPRGSVYGFLGRNGAGKTTTIRLLAGLVQPTGGHARVLDLDPQTDRIAILERTSFVIDKVLLPSMTGQRSGPFQPRVSFPAGQTLWRANTQTRWKSL